MAKLGHPDGEINLTRGAASTGIIQVVSVIQLPNGSFDIQTNFLDLVKRILFLGRDVGGPRTRAASVLPALRQSQA